MSVRFAHDMLVAGGGIGGLAAALACNHAGWRARVFERAPAFSEIGAGLQLGPNATRLLQGWGLADALDAVAYFPDALTVRDAAGNRALACLPLGRDIAARYGAPYATLHRADLHALLLQAVRDTGETVLHLGVDAGSLQAGDDSVCLSGVPGVPGSGKGCEGDALVVADGLWSRLRADVLGDATPPRPTGHFAWRCLVERNALPLALRQASAGVQVWLGPRLHVVAYPVRRGELLNLVVLAEAAPGMAAAAAPEDWNADASPDELAGVLAGTHAGLRALTEAAGATGAWRRWMLHDRPPVANAAAMARGRIALLGDAAHPMLPYLAQGAAMAIEDAAALQQALAMDIGDVPLTLARYALQRWQRVGRVQARARRQAEIFHADGPMRWGRDLAMRALGPRLLDQPWLWGEGR